MSLSPTKTLLGLMVACLLGVCSIESLAQEKAEESKSSDDIEKVIKKKFKSIQTFASEGKWKKIGAVMTKEAANEFCSRQVISAIGIQKILDQMPMAIESLEETADKVADVFDKYEIKSDEIDISSVMKVGGANTASDKDLKKSKEAAEKLQKQILKILDKNGKRWEIVGELFEAQKGSMFAINPINGEIKKIVKKKDAVLAKINPVPPKQEGGVQVRIMTPPVYVRFEKHEKKGWLYCGVDKKETEKAMKEFMKNQGGLGGEMEDEDIF